MRKLSLKQQYLQGRMETGKGYSPQPYRREAPQLKSIDTRVLGAVTSRESKSA